MTNISFDDFYAEKECIFQEERYSVRDNGAVFRHIRNCMRKRPLDTHKGRGMNGRTPQKAFFDGIVKKKKSGSAA